MLSDCCVESDPFTCIEADDCCSEKEKRGVLVIVHLNSRQGQHFVELLSLVLCRSRSLRA